MSLRFCETLATLIICNCAAGALAQAAAEPALPTFVTVSAEVGLPYPMPDDAIVGLVDIDLDGYVDVVTRNRVGVNNGRNRFEAPLVLRGTFISLGDFDNDGDLDAFSTEWRKISVKLDPEDTKTGREKAERARQSRTKRGPAEPQKEEPDPTVEKVKAEHWLLRNDGDGTFTDVLSKSGLTDAPEAQSGPQRDAAINQPTEKLLDVSRAHGFLDYDNDGNLDLFVAGFEITDTPKQTRAVPCRLFKGDGTGHFTNVTEAAGLQVEPRAATAVAFCDFDNDGFVDIYVANSRSPNWLWHNQGDGTFKDVAEEAGATGGAGSSRAVAVADYDNDGDFDVFVVNYAHDDPKKSQPRSMLLRNDSSPDGGLRFTDVTAECALAWEPPEGYKAEATWRSAVWADLNNDGWLDLFVTESADDGKNHPHAPLKYGKLDSGYSKLWLGQGGQSFVRVDKERNKLRIEDSAGVAAGDFDNDGWCDLLVGSNTGKKSDKIDWFDPTKTRTTLLRGRGLGKSGAENAGYLNLVLSAADRALNGAVVEITLNNGEKRRAFLDVSCGGLAIKSNQLHFGLGSGTVSKISVTIPGGESVASFEGSWRNTTLLLDVSKKSPKQPRTIEAWQ